MVDALIRTLDLLLAVLRPAVFTAGALTAGVALVAWAVRTRRLSPFSPISHFLRLRVDPWLITPMERRIIRAGGTPAAAPWWLLAAVVFGGLLLLSALEVVRDELVRMAIAAGAGVPLLAVLLRWTFSLLRVAIFARVIASWVGGSPYHRWWGWAFRLTEWFLAPLRQVIPTLGPFDVSVIVAWFGLGLLEGVVLRVLL